jgi:23S rRNA (pseudouridine1915-N3)-methyltransferase
VPTRLVLLFSYKHLQMKICFWAIGKSESANFNKAVDEYTGRIKNYFPVEWIIYPIPKFSSANSEDDLKRKEADLLLTQIKKDDFIVALDEFGRQMDSIALADFVQKVANQSFKRIIFIIGGGYGLHETILKKASFKWSLSRLTFPHQLVRVILAEQVYRACSILRNEKYHHK